MSISLQTRQRLRVILQNIENADEIIDALDAAGIDLTNHVDNLSNPHVVTKSQVGLSNVDNTSDANKPVSIAQQNALNLKAPIASPTFTGTVSGITKSMVGLGNVDNTSDANKPVSIAQQAALDLKYDANNPNGYETPSQLNVRDTDNRSRSNHTGTQLASTISDFDSAADARVDLHGDLVNNPHLVTKTQIGLSDVDNTSDTDKPVSLAQQSTLDLKEDLSNKDTDITLAANSDTKYSSQKAIKTYVNDTISNAAVMPVNTIKGNNTGSPVVGLNLTPTQATAMLDDFIGEDSVLPGTKGLVPSSNVFDGQTKRKFLKADGSWSAQTEKHASRNEALKAVNTFVGRHSTANQWFGSCYSPYLNLFIAIAASGTNRIAFSKDGENWRDIAAPANNVWTKVCWSPELRIFCAISYDGASRCMTSPDGITWTLQTIALETWYGITWSPELGLFCATSLTGGTGISTSPDGINWTQQNPGPTTNYYSVCWSPELSIFCAIRLNGPAYTSPDGINWTAQSIANNSWSSITWSPELGLFCTVGITGSSRCATSPDGINWTSRSISSSSWRTVSWMSDLGAFITFSSNGTMSYSFDGITWLLGSNPQASNQWYSSLWCKQAGILVITGISGTNRIMTSTRTRDWAFNFTPFAVNTPLVRTGTALTLSELDSNNTTTFTSASPITVTVPIDTTAPNIRVGTKFKMIQGGLGNITINAEVGATLVSANGYLSSRAQYQTMELEKISPNTWILSKSTIIYSASAVLDFPNISSNSYEDLTISVPGAMAGDSVALGLPNIAWNDIGFTSWVSANDIVTVRARNPTGGSVDLPSATYNVAVTRI